MGCGDGRNLPLLLDLGFEVHASEISPEIVGGFGGLARELQWLVHAVGLNASLPYPDHYFDYMLCCASCYYLDGSTTWGYVPNWHGSSNPVGCWWRIFQTKKISS